PDPPDPRGRAPAVADLRGPGQRGAGRDGGPVRGGPSPGGPEGRHLLPAGARRALPVREQGSSLPSDGGQRLLYSHAHGPRDRQRNPAPRPSASLPARHVSPDTPVTGPESNQGHRPNRLKCRSAHSSIRRSLSSGSVQVCFETSSPIGWPFSTTK